MNNVLVGRSRIVEAWSENLTNSMRVGTWKMDCNSQRPLLAYLICVHTGRPTESDLTKETLCKERRFSLVKTHPFIQARAILPRESLKRVWNNGRPALME